MFLSESRLDGKTANTITNGQQVVYTIELANDAALLTPRETVPVCDVGCANVFFQCPDLDGNPGLISLVASNLSIPSGTSRFIASSVTCIVATASGVYLARATAQVRGVLHDVAIPDCETQADCGITACHPDAAYASITSSLLIRRPQLTILSRCLAAVNTGGVISFDVSGTLTNSGDEDLVGVSIVDEYPISQTILKNITMFHPGDSVDFSASFTNSTGLCPAFLNKITASGKALANLGTITDSVTCWIVAFSPFSFRAPTRNEDGSVELTIDGAPGTYLLQASTNLVDWSTISSNTAPSNIISFIDTNAINFESKFYRAVAVCPDSPN